MQGEKWRVIRSLLVTTLIIAPLASLQAEELSRDDIRNLDLQVQEIKSDVLDIAADFNTLEQRLLFPSGTRLSVFLSIVAQKNFRLDAVKIEIDGELATHNIYSAKELEALQKGGVQNVYTGNITTGKHELSVTMMGKLKTDEEFEETGNFVFAKGVEPKTLGITLAGPGLSRNGIQFDNW